MSCFGCEVEDLMADAVSTSFLDDFARAWNRHDTDTILSMMSEDCVFEASRGPDVKGTIYTGQNEVRRGIEEVFATFPDARWNGPRHFIAGNRGVSEWVFTATGLDGTRIEVQGCDVFTFRDGKIAVKTHTGNNGPVDSLNFPCWQPRHRYARHP